MDIVNHRGRGIDIEASSSPPIKKPFGIFSNVLLTEAEHADLLMRVEDARTRLDKFSAYLKSKNKQYDDHYAKLIEFASQDGKLKPSDAVNAPSTPDQIEPFSGGKINKPLELSKGDYNGVVETYGRGIARDALEAFFTSEEDLQCETDSDDLQKVIRFCKANTW